MREVSTPNLDVSKMVQPISRGGTGSNQAAGAASNLNLVTTAMKDVDNGVFSLNAQGKIPGTKFPNANGVNKVNIDGSLTAYIGLQLQLQITDYDSFRSWTVSVSAGTISRNNDVLTFTPPATPQTVTLTINGRTLPITVSNPVPAQPSILVPTSGSNAVGDTPIIQASAFQALGDSSTHTSTDWQLATDSGFTTIVGQSLNDTVNKTTWQAPNLTVSTTYYLRCRYKGSNGNFSAYSTTSIFTTRSTFQPVAEEASFTFEGSYADPPQSVCVSDDGLRVATAYYYFSGAMKIVVCSKTSGSWAVEQVIATVTNGFSLSVIEPPLYMKMNGLGDRLIWGEPSTNGGGGSNSGAVSIWSRSGTTWSQEARLLGVNGTSVTNAQFGVAVWLDTNGTRAFMMAASPSYVVSVWTRSGTTWTLEQNVTAAALYSRTMAVDNLGSCFVLALQDGTFSVWDRSGTTWSQSATGLLSNSGTTRIAISNGGAYIAYATTSVVGVLKRSANTWSAYYNTVNSTLSQPVINADGTVIAFYAPRSAGVRYLKLTGTTWALNASFQPATTPNASQGVTLRADGAQLIIASQVRFISFI